MTTIHKSTKIVPVLVFIIISGVMLVSLDMLTTIVLGDIMATISTSTNTTELASTLLRARDAVLTFDVSDIYKSYQF